MNEYSCIYDYQLVGDSGYPVVSSSTCALVASSTVSVSLSGTSMVSDSGDLVFGLGMVIVFLSVFFWSIVLNTFNPK